jgi:hypothetical protein
MRDHFFSYIDSILILQAISLSMVSFVSAVAAAYYKLSILLLNIIKGESNKRKKMRTNNTIDRFIAADICILHRQSNTANECDNNIKMKAFIIFFISAQNIIHTSVNTYKK